MYIISSSGYICTKLINQRSAIGKGKLKERPMKNIFSSFRMIPSERGWLKGRDTLLHYGRPPLISLHIWGLLVSH